MQVELKKWTPRSRPTNELVTGRYIDIAAYDGQKHGQELWDAFGGKATNDLLFHFGWAKMNTADDLRSTLDKFNETGEFVTCVFQSKESGKAVGMASYMSIVIENGVVETGAVAHGSEIQKSRAATEAHFLMAKRVFDDLGYRRYEWKLNNPNTASHNAAKRFGFTFEGVFRQHQVKPYGNRDTAWYSMLDKEWPSRKIAFETWLSPDNFNADGTQRQRLEDLR